MRPVGRILTLAASHMPLIGELKVTDSLYNIDDRLVKTFVRSAIELVQGHVVLIILHMLMTLLFCAQLSLVYSD